MSVIMLCCAADFYSHCLQKKSLLLLGDSECVFYAEMLKLNGK